MKERIPIPPIEAQMRIAEMVRTEARIRSASARTAAFLNDYRVRLILDVVTGKLDVREAAANLPDRDDETGLLADEDLLADESEFAEEEQEAALEEVEA